MDNMYILNGSEYRFNVMPPTTALPLMVKLGNVIGSGAGGIDIGQVMSMAKDKKTPDGSVLDSIGKLLTCLKSEDVMFITSTCLPLISVKKPTDTKPHVCNIDLDFTGNILDLIKVVGQFLRFTFSDFFPESLLSSPGSENLTE